MSEGQFKNWGKKERKKSVTRFKRHTHFKRHHFLTTAVAVPAPSEAQLRIRDSITKAMILE